MDPITVNPMVCMSREKVEEEVVAEIKDVRTTTRKLRKNTMKLESTTSEMLGEKYQVKKRNETESRPSYLLRICHF